VASTTLRPARRIRYACIVRFGVWVVVLAGCRFGFGERDGMHDASITRDAYADAITVMDGTTDSSQPFVCPGNYSTVGSLTSKYLGLNTSMTWDASEALCEADGTHLVVLDDAAELTAMLGVVPGQNLWTGVTDRIAVGTFRKVTGPNATFLPWDTSEPDALAAECVYVDSLTMKLVDQGCGSGRRGVCECDGILVDPASY